MRTSPLLLFLMITATAFAVTPGENPAAKPELPKTGVNLARANGGWLNVQVKDHQFTVNFYDANKESIASDVTGGLVRFVYVARASSHQWRIALTPAVGKPSLISPQRVKPPHVFRVYLTLYREKPVETVENYAFQYP